MERPSASCCISIIKGVALYGGTRHITTWSLKEFCSPEEIKRATMHTTNRAFKRYLQIRLEDVNQVYQKTKADKALTRHSSQLKTVRRLKLHDLYGEGGGRTADYSINSLKYLIKI